MYTNMSNEQLVNRVNELESIDTRNAQIEADLILDELDSRKVRKQYGYNYFAYNGTARRVDDFPRNHGTIN
jgi:hypothetical protein